MGPQNAQQLAEETNKLKVAVIGLSIATVPLLDPLLSLLDVFVQRYGQTTTSPLAIRRSDGSLYSQEPLSAWLQRAAATSGGVVQGWAWGAVSSACQGSPSPPTSAGSSTTWDCGTVAGRSSSGDEDHGVWGDVESEVDV